MGGAHRLQTSQSRQSGESQQRAWDCGNTIRKHIPQGKGASHRLRLPGEGEDGVTWVEAGLVVWVGDVAAAEGE